MTNARLSPAERALPGYAPDANDGAPIERAGLMSCESARHGVVQRRGGIRTLEPPGGPAPS